MKIPQSSQLSPIRQDVSRHAGRNTQSNEIQEEKTQLAPFNVSAAIETKDAPSPVYAISTSSESGQSAYYRPQLPGIFKESQQKAIDLYNITASINSFGGEGDLIGVDIYV